jgi:hypothetical protein
VEQASRDTIARPARPYGAIRSPSLHGKEGVDGSSPSEGSAKSPLTGIFRFSVQADLLLVERAVGMEPFMELPRSRVPARAAHSRFVPILLGGGARLSENLGDAKLEQVESVEAPGVTHIRYARA